MADLSKLEIIGQYPIGTGLDAFREAFSSTCEDLGYHKCWSTPSPWHVT
jgi:hypothetical protein